MGRWGRFNSRRLAGHRAPIGPRAPNLFENAIAKHYPEVAAPPPDQAEPLRELVRAAGPYRMRVVCCDCGVSLGEKPCDKGQEGLVSHGYCPACEAKMMEKIREWKNRITP